MDRLNDFVSGSPSLPLAILHSIFSPLQGFCNALVYGMNRQVLMEWRYSSVFRKMPCCRGRSQNEFASHELLRDENHMMDEDGHEMSFVFEDNYVDPSGVGMDSIGGVDSTRSGGDVVVLVDENEAMDDREKW